MMRLKLWQWAVLATPIAAIVGFLLVSAGTQIQEWGISWIWGIFALLFAGWRWLIGKWTRPAIEQMEAATKLEAELKSTADKTGDRPAGSHTAELVEAALQDVLAAARNDLPIWEDWQAFWQRCQELIVAIARIHHPEQKYPLLNIYVPQAYGLIRGTVGDMDRWMQQLSPVLDRVTIGQAYQAYETYRQLEPSARKLWQAWGWVQWLLNPVAALAKQASAGYSDRATQQLLGNLSHMLREAALRNLCLQAIALYGGSTLLPKEFAVPAPTLPEAKTQTLLDILARAEPVEEIEQKPVNILLAGRTGAGKSSLIDSLFQADLAAIDVLPSTDKIQSYHWQTSDGQTLTLWDTPGYEQANRADLRSLVLDFATRADLLLLVTPALDPALQMDVDFLQDIQAEVPDLPAIAVVTQVDRLRPIREWNPPYDWQWAGAATPQEVRPKEVAIREATEYRVRHLDNFSKLVLPVVTSDSATGRVAWGIDVLALALVEAIAPAKQIRLARFLRDREARAIAATRIVDRYTLQMATAQGLTALLKSPILQFISTLSTGSPALAYLLAEKIPVEQLPVVIGKLQMAYDLFSLLSADTEASEREGTSTTHNFDLLLLWPLLLENDAAPDRNARAFGYALVEYWTQNSNAAQLQERFQFYLNRG